jgi:hypothetical protein
MFKTILSLYIVYACLSFACERRILAAICVQPLPELVAWYRGDGDASDFFGAHSGTARNGVAFVSGLVGQAFQFDGIDDTIEVPEAAELHPSRITVETWINPSAIKVGSRIVSQELAANSCQYPFIAYSLDLRSNEGSKAAFFFSTTADLSLLHEVTSKNAIPLNQFTHLAATFDGTEARMYVNGVLEGTIYAPGDLRGSSQPIFIGAPGPGCRAVYPSLGEFVGIIDELSIYTRVLTAAEIQAIFKAGAAGKCASPRLRVQHNADNVIVSWTPALTGFGLEQTVSLSTPSWSVAPSGNPTPPISPAGKTTYYRLRAL